MLHPRHLEELDSRMSVPQGVQLLSIQFTSASTKGKIYSMNTTKVKMIKCL
jgi:hypothetical protein